MIPHLRAFFAAAAAAASFVAACGGSTTTDLGGSSSGASSSSGGSSSGGSSSGASSGGSSSGSSGGRDAGPDAGYLACMDGQGTVDPSFKKCRVDGDCVVVRGELDCCGTIRFIGLGAASAGPFAACEQSWEAHFPGCGCASGRSQTEDGKESGPGQDAGAPAVRCTNVTAGSGVCMSFTP